MLGIGLGGFMDGFQKAQDFKIKQRQQERLDQRAEREQTLNQRQDAEYARTQKMQDDVRQIGLNAQTDFNQRVAAGTAKPEDFDTIWREKAVPKLLELYGANGDHANMEYLRKWADSADTRRGAKLAHSAMTKVNTGDIPGAFSDAQEASKLAGYNGTGYVIEGQETIMRDGAPIFTRLRLRGPDGKESIQDVPKGAEAKLINGVINPFEQARLNLEKQSKAAESAAEDERKLDYRRREKEQDRQLGLGLTKENSDIYNTLAKEYETNEDGVGFAQLPKEEQWRLMEERRALLNRRPGITPSNGQDGGAPASNPPHKLGNKLTGKLDDPAAARPPASAAPQARPSRPSPEQSRRSNMDYMLKEAEQALADGHRPEAIADGLIQNGIPQDQWPPSLASALSGKGRLVTGLNVR